MPSYCLPGIFSQITGYWGTNWKNIPSFIIEGIVKAGLMESRKATGTAVFSINPRRHPSARCAKQNARTHVHGYPPVAAARQSAQT
jgi:hypothetical protein